MAFVNDEFHSLSQQDRQRIVKFLIKNRAEINVNDEFGKTPLYYAARGSHAKNTQLLAQLGANIHIRNRNGQTLREATASNSL